MPREDTIRSGFSDDPVRLTPGFWKLSPVTRPGHYAQVTLQDSQGKSVRVCLNSAEDCLIVTRSAVTLNLVPETGMEDVHLSQLGLSAWSGVRCLISAIGRQMLRGPRTCVRALYAQFQRGGVFAIPCERARVLNLEGDTGGDVPEPVIHLPPGDVLLPGALARLRSVFAADNIEFVTWDTCGPAGEILPRPMPLLQASSGYAASGWARRAGHHAEGSPAPDAWIHLPEPMARRTTKLTLPPRPAPRAPAQNMTASIIIPTRDRPELLRACLSALRETGIDMSQLVLVDHLTQDLAALELLDAAERQGAVRIKADGPFNFSKLANLGAERADADLLVFLNNDVRPLKQGWLSALVSEAVVSTTGVVGAELHYPDGRLQHAGIVNSAELGPVHVNSGASAKTRGPFNMLDYTRECLAVTGACFATRRDVFDKLGGFSTDYPEDYNDVDYCLRAREHGFAVVITPDALLEHAESATRQATETVDVVQRRAGYLERLRARHPVLSQPDPYSSPRWAQNPPMLRPAFWRV